MAPHCDRCGSPLPTQISSWEQEAILQSVKVYDRKGLVEERESVNLCPICTRRLMEWLHKDDRVSRIA